MAIQDNFKFTRQSRLLTQQDFKQVFENAKKFGSGCFVFLVKPNGLSYPRLGVVLSKRKIPLAVQRNRLRRLIRESFRGQTNLGGLDVVVLAKHGADSVSNAAIKRDLFSKWQKCVEFSGRF